MIDPNWSRWIYASVSGLFYSNISPEYPLLIDGTHRPTELPPVLIEFRMTGPTYRELNNNEYELAIIVNCLYKISMSETDFHLPYKVVGKVSSVFGTPTPIYKKGDGVDDTGDLIGCLTLKSGPRVLHYGQIAKDVLVEQGSIEGTYKIFLTGE